MTAHAVSHRRVLGWAWFGVLAPPLAWAIQLVTGYALEEAGCGRPDSSIWGAGLGGLTGIVAIVCGAVAVAGGAGAVAAWRAPKPRGASGVVEFLAAWGIAASFIFLFAIVLTGITVIPLDACSPG